MFDESAIDILCDPDTHDPIVQQAGALVNAKVLGRFDAKISHRVVRNLSRRFSMRWSVLKTSRLLAFPQNR